MNKNYVLAAIIAVIVVVLVLYLASNSLAPTVQNGDNVSVFYTGSFTNGTIFNSNLNSSPFIFKVGANQTIPGFNSAVLGMRLNQTKTVTIPVNEAYGPVNPSLIIAIPLSNFKNQSVKIGDVITDSQNGRVLQGIVVGLNNTTAITNFNPPLAGKVLTFTIRVVKISK
jgi:FKBP-type peptidyl-prolyl cis-trans isomerase 2